MASKINLELIGENKMINLVNKFGKFSIPTIALFLTPMMASAATNLSESDYVGISFWIVSIAMVAATVFFLMEANKAEAGWSTSLTVAGLVTLVAAVHYFYMRGVWVDTQTSPTVFRYVDWIITVPLQIIEFYLILAAVGAVAGNVFWKLLGASLVMLIFGYLGEIGAMQVWLAFAIGMAGWIYIIWAIFAGDAQEKLSEAPEGVQSAFKAMRLIVLVGWSIYPIGYVYGYAAEVVNEGALNGIYNIADFVNKIAFGLMIWAAATSSRKAVK